MVRTDYFTRAEFMAFAGDSFAEPDIDRAQASVIDHLEKWAGTAWPTLDTTRKGDITTGTPDLELTTGEFATDGSDVGQIIVVVGAGADGADLVTTIEAVADETHATLDINALTTVAGAVVRKDGDGTAALLRSTVDTFDPDKYFELEKIPVVELTAITANGDTIDVADVDLYAEEGFVTAPGGIGSRARGVVIAYTFGFTDTPAAVKLAAMRATKSLLRSTVGKGSKVPANVGQYTTESTTFVFDKTRDDYLRPWPWDADASQSVRSYWSADKPMTVGAV